MCFKSGLRRYFRDLTQFRTVFSRNFSPCVTLVTAKNQHRCWKARVYARTWGNLNGAVERYGTEKVVARNLSFSCWHLVFEIAFYAWFVICNVQNRLYWKYFVTFSLIFPSLGLYRPLYIQGRNHDVRSRTSIPLSRRKPIQYIQPRIAQ